MYKKGIYCERDLGWERLLTEVWSLEAAVLFSSMSAAR
jgi:hypothetical protein